MTTAIAQAGDYTNEQVELIRRTLCAGATNDELTMFIGQSKRMGLDPFSGQIKAIKRRAKNQATGQWEDRLTIITGIDGFRLIAERTGKYAGQLGPFWSDGKLYPIYDATGTKTGENFRWLEAWPFDAPPLQARVGVLRSDFREPLWGSATLASYGQRDKDGNLVAQWAKMPDVMLAKCAESLALRKAFPNELSGAYTGEEMSQADNPATNPRPNPAVPQYAPQKQLASRPTGPVEAAIGDSQFEPRPDDLDQIASDAESFKAAFKASGLKWNPLVDGLNREFDLVEPYAYSATFDDYTPTHIRWMARQILIECTRRTAATAV